MNIQPIGERVLIRPFLKGEISSKRSSGILLINSDEKEKSEQGLVLASDSTLVKVKDKVVFSRYGYESIMDNEEELYLIEEKNILAIINE